MMRRVVATEGAPAAIGPYSQAIVYGGIVYTAGQIALDPDDLSGPLVGAGDVAAETEQVLQNLTKVLHAAGTGMGSVLRCDVFLADMGDFDAMNAVYARHMPEDPPARTTVQAAGLPRGARVEIAAIAAVPQ